MNRTHLFSLLLLLLAARPVAAESSDQFRIDPVTKVKIEGLSAKETATFYAGVEAITNHLASIAAVNTPVPPVCIALQREVFRVPLTPKQAQGKVNIAYLTLMSGQTCRKAKIVNSTVELSLNLAPFANNATAFGEDEAGWLLSPQKYDTLQDGLFFIQVNKRRYYVITRDREAALVPVTMERYLKAEERKAQQQLTETEEAGQRHREWVDDMHSQYGRNLEKADAKMRDMFMKNIEQADKEHQQSLAKATAARDDLRGRLASLSPAQRAEPACVEYLNGGLAQNVRAGRCEAPVVSLFAINPALSKPGADKGALRYLVIEVLDGRHSTEAEHNFRHRTDLMEQFDFAALARVLRAAGK
jgi:hypothetical protein